MESHARFGPEDLFLERLSTHRFQSKKPGQKKAPGKAGQRYWKNVGLGFKTPKEAIEGWNTSAEPQQ